MDRTSKKTITLILLFLLSFSLLFFGLLFFLYNQYVLLETELTAIYPELSDIMANSFSHYKEESYLIIIVLYLLILFLYAFSIYFLLQCLNHSKCKEITSVETTLELTKEELLHTLQINEELVEEESNTKGLLSDIAHQLKTPFASLKLCHELAHDDSLSFQEQQEFQMRQNKELHRLESLIEELMKLSQLEDGLIHLKKEKASIKETLSESISHIFMKAHEKHIELDINVMNDAQVLHDSKWTSQIFCNILENAIKYSPSYTRIQIETIKIPNWIIIKITDEGIGIAPDELHKIYHRFYRGRSAAQLSADGVGIGLYLARKLLLEQNAIIQAMPRPPKGTTFQITFPC